MSEVGGVIQKNRIFSSIPVFSELDF